MLHTAELTIESRASRESDDNARASGISNQFGHNAIGNMFNGESTIELKLQRLGHCNEILTLDDPGAGYVGKWRGALLPRLSTLMACSKFKATHGSRWRR